MSTNSDAFDRIIDSTVEADDHGPLLIVRYRITREEADAVHAQCPPMMNREETAALLRANGIDPATVLGGLSEGPTVDGGTSNVVSLRRPRRR